MSNRQLLKIWVCVLALTLLAAGMVFSLYSAAYFAWLSATPLTQERLARVQWDFRLWTAIAAVCGVWVVVIGVALGRSWSRSPDERM